MSKCLSVGCFIRVIVSFVQDTCVQSTQRWSSVFIFVFFKNQAFIVVIVALLASVRQRSLGIFFCALWNPGVLIVSFTYICLKKGFLRFQN